MAAALTLVAAIGIPGAAAAIPTFAGYQVAGGWPTSWVKASADWSSDLGADYRFELTNTVPVAASGQGSLTATKAIGPTDAGFDLHYALDSRGGAAGNTYSEGWLSVPDAGTVSPSQVFSLRLRSVLGTNAVGYGIETAASIGNSFFFDNVTSTDQIYYAMDWSGTVTTVGETYGRIELHGIGANPFDPLPRRAVVGQFAGNNHDVNNEQLASGTTALSGSDAGALGLGDAVARLEFLTDINDNSGIAGEGVMDMTVRIAFSTTPIDSVPSPVGTPEPGTLALLGIGITAFRVRRRKR